MDVLTDSQARLEAAGLALAIKDRKARMVRSCEEWEDGWTVWSPGEMLTYVEVDEHSRAVMRALKGVR